MKKCGSYPINDFEGWPPLDNRDDNGRDLVYFAVKKEHDMNYRYDFKGKAFTFTEMINKAILENLDGFEYHNHSYTVTINKDGNYDVISNGKNIAEAMIDEGECIVDIDDENRNYVRNTISKYYDEKYSELFAKVRIKEYGIPSEKENQER